MSDAITMSDEQTVQALVKLIPAMRDVSLLLPVADAIHAANGTKPDYDSRFPAIHLTEDDLEEWLGYYKPHRRPLLRDLVLADSRFDNFFDSFEGDIKYHLEALIDRIATENKIPQEDHDEEDAP